MSSSSEILQRIRIARLQFCHNDLCPFSQNLHLNVDYDHVELSNTKAPAISYTWGEFDREKVKIGHDISGRVVEMELGKEWDVQETIMRLAMLCIENGEEHGSEHAGVWIDQLCIRQTDEAEIRATLASIPTIYRSLEVVILMPGGLCGCLREARAKIIASPEIRRVFQARNSSALFADKAGNPRDQDYIAAIVSSRKILDCVNAYGACTYFDRIWTRQELLYSHDVRVVRTRDDEMACASSPADAGHLSSFVDKLYHRLLKTNPPHVAFTEVRNASMDVWTKVEESLLDFGSPRTRLKFGCDHGVLTRLDFLLGERLKKLIPRGVDAPVQIGLLQFLTQIALLGRSTRKTTKARDYVTSVWVDCPGYVLPANYKKMCLPSLLADGIRQLESKHGISVEVSCLAGFFGFNSIGSALWRPMTYLGRRKIEGVSDVYRTVLSATPLPITPSGEIPLRLTPLPRTAFSQLAVEYSKSFSNSPITKVVEELGSIIRNWVPWCADRIASRVGEYITLSLTSGVHNDPRIPFLYKLYGMWMSDQRRNALSYAGFSNTEVRTWNGWENFDHYSVVYSLIATVLGLDVRDCQNCGLKLMVVPGHCIGFTTPVLKSEAGREEAITVSITHFSGILKEVHRITKPYWVTLEAVKVADQPVPRYRATGIWVPQDKLSLQVGAYVDQNDYDALLE